jgi:glycerol uptake facilitator-like aquaporin
MSIDTIESMDQSLPLPRRAAAEGVAAFARVFAGCGAIVTDAHYDGALGAVGVSLVFGLIIMVMVYATGHLSGAHINPAVTVAFALNRHFPARAAAAYVAAQLVGAAAGALLLHAVWPDQPAQLGATVPSVAVGSAFIYELVITAFLMFAVRWSRHGRFDEPGTLVRPPIGALAYQVVRGDHPTREAEPNGSRTVRLPA